MNAKQMATALKAFGNLIGGSEAVALTKFAQLFENMGEIAASAVAAQVAKNWKADGRIAKRPAELENAVCRIGEALATTGAKAQAAVFAKVSLILLSGREHQDVEHYVRDAITARVKRAPLPKIPKQPKVAKPKFTDLAPELAHRLTASACDRGRFDALLKDYEERFKATELKEIANRTLGFEVDKKKKLDIVKAVRNWQREEELNTGSRKSQAKAGL
jgi:hypothetical protein